MQNSELFPTHSNIFWGLDPSIRSTGLAVYCPKDKSIDLVKLETTEEPQTFIGTYRATQRQLSSIGAALRTWGMPRMVIQEYPPPCLRYSPGLFMAGALIKNYLQLRGIPVILAASDRTKQLLGLKKITKDDTVAACKRLCEANNFVVRDEGVEPVWKRLLSDKADAMFLLIYLLHNTGHDITLLEEFNRFKWLLKEEAVNG